MASPHLPWGLPRTSGHPGPGFSPRLSAGSGLAQRRRLLQLALTWPSEGQVLAWVGLELPAGGSLAVGVGAHSLAKCGSCRGGDWLQASAPGESGAGWAGPGASDGQDPTLASTGGGHPRTGALLRGRLPWAPGTWRLPFPPPPSPTGRACQHKALGRMTAAPTSPGGASSDACWWGPQTPPRGIRGAQGPSAEPLRARSPWARQSLQVNKFRPDY